MPTLDPQVATVLRELDGLTPDLLPDMPPEVVRDQFRLMLKHLRTATPKPFDGSVVDELVDATDDVPTGHDVSGAEALPPVAVRRYTPAGWLPGGPVVVWIHGGGWVVGDLDSAEPSAVTLASTTGAQVVSVDYRLAPEHPFPAALEDCLIVVRREMRRGARSSEGADPAPSWLAVGGDSAGGNLAAAVALAAPGAGIKLDAALLVYPAVDASMATPSHRSFAQGHLLTAEAMDFYWNAYAGPRRSESPRISELEPASATDLSAFPPTVVTTAGFDPLRDEGDALADRLAAAGVDVTHLRAAGLTHGWLDMTDRVPAAHAERLRTFTVFTGLLPHQA